MKTFKTSLYFAIILFLACGKSKVDSKFAEAAKALNAYAQAIEENSTDCNKMANALEKPIQNLKKILAKISIELKDKKVEPTEEVNSARDRVTKASTKVFIQCASHPRILRLFQSLQLKSID